MSGTFYYKANVTGLRKCLGSNSVTQENNYRSYQQNICLFFKKGEKEKEFIKKSGKE